MFILVYFRIVMEPSRRHPHYDRTQSNVSQEFLDFHPVWTSNTILTRPQPVREEKTASFEDLGNASIK